MRSLLNTVVTALVWGHTTEALVSGPASGFGSGQPVNGNGKGAPILGGPIGHSISKTLKVCASRAEWGYVYAGSILVSAVNENGEYQVAKLDVGDVWYFHKGEAHTVQGLEDENEFQLVFDEGNFDVVGTTFNIDDWVAHTPVSVLAKNFNLSESVFGSVPSPNPYILNATVDTQDVTENVPGHGGTLRIIDSTTFPIATTIAATDCRHTPTRRSEGSFTGILMPLSGYTFAKAKQERPSSIGNTNARTFDFSAGDTAPFPDNSGHYIGNTSPTEELVWTEIYKSDKVKDISLTQWLALTPANIVADVLKIPLDVAKSLKKEKQILLQ
ncbi:putative Cupin type-1 domain-containing protein [Seiridium cardinale]|uniref:Cupin type-1 domain-containing protein n=1 Tax=Seiridium cardinale TaxID=138064 RepID=A0ABR2XUT4_9PEZI